MGGGERARCVGEVFSFCLFFLLFSFFIFFFIFLLSFRPFCVLSLSHSRDDRQLIEAQLAAVDTFLEAPVFYQI